MVIVAAMIMSADTAITMAVVKYGCLIFRHYMIRLKQSTLTVVLWNWLKLGKIKLKNA